MIIENHEGSGGQQPDRGGTFIGMSLAAISGSVVSFVLKGDFFISAVMIFIAIVFAYLGWYIRDVAN